MELDIIFPSIPYQLQLSELILDNVTVVSGYLSHLLNETFSLDRLCIQSKTASEFYKQYQPVLAPCAVQTLDFEVQTALPSHFYISTDDLPQSRCLRGLHQTGVHVDAEVLTSIGQECRHLEELTVVGRMVRVVPREWIAFVKPPFVGWCWTVKDAILEAAALSDIGDRSELLPCSPF